MFSVSTVPQVVLLSRYIKLVFCLMCLDEKSGPYLSYSGRVLLIIPRHGDQGQSILEHPGLGHFLNSGGQDGQRSLGFTSSLIAESLPEVDVGVHFELPVKGGEAVKSQNIQKFDLQGVLLCNHKGGRKLWYPYLLHRWCRSRYHY